MTRRRPWPLLSLFLVLGLARAAGGATPTLIQHLLSAHESSAADTTTGITATLPNLSGAGNCIVVIVQIGTATTALTVTDDKANTYTAGPSVSSGQLVQVWYALNVASGTSVITIKPNVADANFQASVSEWYNIATSAAADGSATTGSQAGPNLTAGSFTPGTSGDLVIHYAADITANTPAGGPITTFAAGTNGGVTFQMMPGGANVYEGIGVQYGVQATAQAVNPPMTVNGTLDSFTSVAFALKSAAAGTAPGAGIRIQAITHVSVPTGSGTSLKFQFPHTGNLIVPMGIGFNAAANCTISSITDTQGNSYSSVDADVQNTGAGNVQIWHADNVSASQSDVLTITVANAGDTIADQYHFYDLTGAATAPLGAHNTTTGNQVVTANLATNTVTPQASTSVLLHVVGINTHTVSGVTGAGFITDIFVNPPDNGGGNTLDQDNGFAHIYNASGATTFTYTIQHNTAPAGVQQWAAAVAEFKAPAAGRLFRDAWDSTGTGAGGPLYRTVPE